MYSYKYITPFKELVSQIDLKLYYCGTEDCQPGHSWGPAVKDHYKIHYVHSGKGIFKIGEETYNIKDGQCFLICPDIVSYYKADEEDPWTYYWVAFNGLNVRSYLNRAGLTVESPVINCCNDDIIIDCFTRMFEGSKTSSSGDLRLLSSLYEFLSIIIDESAVKTAADKSTKKDNLYIAKAIEWFELNYSSSVSISEIADYIGLNRKYFSKLFKESIGMSPQNFLINLRLNKACDLMKNSYLSIGEISRSVGYEDQLLFSRIFKKFKGVSPNQFRSEL